MTTTGGGGISRGPDCGGSHYIPIGAEFTCPTPAPRTVALLERAADGLETFADGTLRRTEATIPTIRRDVASLRDLSAAIVLMQEYARRYEWLRRRLSAVVQGDRPMLGISSLTFSDAPDRPFFSTEATRWPVDLGRGDAVDAFIDEAITKEIRRG